MGLAIKDKWIWDFWLADDGSTYHVYFLQAPRSLGDPELRHFNASVGYATSGDLRSWTVHGDALGPGGASAWDSLATWTGSVIEREGTWYMFYTGASLERDHVVQRIGLATSTDLAYWKKDPTVVIEADARWYEKLNPDVWYEEAWRDPWVYLGSDGQYHMLITARASDGSPDGRGVIGHAASPDLIDWTVRPPLSQPGEFGHLEVPQVERIDGSYKVVFSVDASRASHSRIDRLGSGSPDATFIVDAESDLGPFDIASAEPALDSSLYTGRLIRDRSGDWVWLACRAWADDGTYQGTLTDPIPFVQKTEG